MKKIMLALLVLGTLHSCKEDEAITPEQTTNQSNSNTCGDMKICFDANDTAYSSTVVMYQLDDTSYFAKYELNGRQLSIDWFTDSARIGRFEAGANKIQGKSRVYWIPRNNEIWMSQSGQVEITKHENKTVSARFSGMLNKMVNGLPSTESIEVKNGVFTNGRYF